MLLSCLTMTDILLQNNPAVEFKSQICDWLNWSELQYGAFQYQCGCLYLQYYISKDPGAIDEVLQHPIFWKWWKDEWLDRDYVFTGTLLKCSELSIDEKEMLYRNWHDARVLANELSGVGIIMSNGYKLMIREIIKSEAI
jgi:hypothetical protein